MSRLMRFPSAVKRDPAVDAWMQQHPGPLGAIAQQWFEVMRSCGDDVRELLHDGHPTACVGDAAFGYVNAFTNHVNVGFFLGPELDDPKHLLEGTGKFMRHVKLRPGQEIDSAALGRLVMSAYTGIGHLLAPGPNNSFKPKPLRGSA
ncbi:DUF1801 domain-containing protein [Lysobacter yangpyeongensis]|uniref:DUF1801 domain-containing protein n=1 Tax=Lysobacter yangpyeongensis TaxID=346182 RepID=A0ABW0SHL6_9GAMM